MAMTVKRAARLTGYDIRRLPAGEERIRFGAFSGETLVAETCAATDWLALRNLVDIVYRKHSLDVLKTHNGRCARCHRKRAVHIHHRQYRSHGGTHQAKNLEPVCWECHRLIHEQERSA